MNSSFESQIDGPACLPTDVKAFEEFANCTLPASYFEFLLNHNGCIPSPTCDTFVSEIDLPGGNEITIHQFFSLSNEHETLRCLYHELEGNVGLMQFTVIPIGIDSFGNLIGLDCESGEVNWTLCQPQFTMDYLKAFLLCSSFDYFIQHLVSGPYAA